MNTLSHREALPQTLLAGLPYIRLFRGKVFVLKAGGALCGDPVALRSLAEQVTVLHELGVRVVLVHGGGPQTTALAGRLGLASRFVDGRRVTDPETLDVAVMTINGSARTAILAACRAAGLPAIGLSGIDAGLIKARRRPPQLRTVDGVETLVDFGCVGDVTGVDASVLQRLLDAGFLPVVSPLCADDGGQVLNVNADTVAATIACGIGAEKLVFLTDTPGILEDREQPGSLVSYTDISGLRGMIDRGVLGAGMLPKAQAAVRALQDGVKRVHLVGYKGAASLLVEVFTNEGAGTLVVRSTSDLLPAELAAAALVPASLAGGSGATVC